MLNKTPKFNGGNENLRKYNEFRKQNTHVYGPVLNKNDNREQGKVQLINESSQSTKFDVSAKEGGTPDHTEIIRHNNTSTVADLTMTDPLGLEKDSEHVTVITLDDDIDSQPGQDDSARTRETVNPPNDCDLLLNDICMATLEKSVKETFNTTLPELEVEDIVSLNVSSGNEDENDEDDSDYSPDVPSRFDLGPLDGIKIVKDDKDNYLSVAHITALTPALNADVDDIIDNVLKTKPSTTAEPLYMSFVLEPNKAGNPLGLEDATTNKVAQKLADPVDPTPPRITKQGTIDKRTLKKSKVHAELEEIKMKNEATAEFNRTLNSVIYSGRKPHRKRRYDLGIEYLKNLNEQAACGDAIAKATSDKHISSTVRKNTDQNCILIGKSADTNYRYTIPQNSERKEERNSGYEYNVIRPTPWVSIPIVNASGPACQPQTLSTLRQLLGLKQQKK